MTTIDASRLEGRNMSDVKLDQRRVQAMENLLAYYLKEDHFSGHREIKLPISENNSVVLSFRSAPCKEDINQLIAGLDFIKTQCPKEPPRVNSSIINECLEQAGLPPIKNEILT